VPVAEIAEIAFAPEPELRSMTRADRVDRIREMIVDVHVAACPR
jgi:hypothetical protein